MQKSNVTAIPEIGLGTWQNKDHATCSTSVKTAIEEGYRHIDTAQIYKNEEAVGEGISRSDVDREDLFVATKLWNDQTDPENVEESAAESLDRLGLEYVDLLYVHWPAGDYDPEGTLPAMESLKEQNRIRHIGVSNFTPELLEEAFDVLTEPPLALQVEMHPYLPQRELQEICLEKDMYLVSYSPFRHGTIFDDSVLQEIAKNRDATPAQICLAWLISKQNVVTIPKATGKDHIRENYRALEVELTDEEISRIDDIDTRSRYIEPPFAPDWKHRKE